MSPAISICRCAIRLASLLVPRGLRTEWADQWTTEIWHGRADLTSRGVSRAEARRKLLRFSMGAFSDAADLRRSEFDPRSVLAHPAFCLAVPLVVLGVLFVATHGLQNCREMVIGLPGPQPGQLLLLSRSARVLGIEAEPAVADLLAWQRQDAAASLAGFAVEGRVLQVTPNFYNVLGAVPRVPFRFLGHTIDAIAPLDRKSGKVGVLARLRSSARREQLEAELGQVTSPSGTAVAAKFVKERMREPLVFSASVWALALFIGVALVRGRLCGIVFFFAKTALVQGVVTLAWAEFAAGLTVSPTGALSPTTGFLLPGSLLIGAALAFWWSLHDQKGRCPVCCRLLAMPVRFGSSSSVILDRPGVELLCPVGHGSLLIPDSVVHGAEPASWTPFDESWSGCFAQGGSR
jgi:hypothetical protein